MDLKQAFERTKEAVYAASDHRQRPYTYDGVVGQYYFNAPATIVNNPPPSSDLSARQELAFWNSVDRNDAQSLELYLQRFPQGVYASLARLNLERLRAPAVEVSRPSGPTAGTVRTNPKDGQRYVWIPPGSFMMGCSPFDNECDNDEKPVREVEITKGFLLGETEVTQAAYERVSGSNPSHFKGPDLPVETVNWENARDYCAAIGGRLPTEAEWEYAARAGTTSSRYRDLDEVAWYARNSGQQTHAVKGKKANPWGLYDMLGNVWEWTADAYDSNAKTLRGGSWSDYPRNLRVSDRVRDALPTVIATSAFGVRGNNFALLFFLFPL